MMSISPRSCLKTLLIFMVLALPGAAQMGDHLKEEFHNAEAYGIQIVDRVSGLRAALHDEAVRVICFQAFGETLDDEAHAELLEWVRAGRSVWFYDARLAPRFGMSPTTVPPEEFRNKPESGVLGGKKRAGLATTAMSLGAHAVQTGVGQVTIFLPEMYLPDSKAPVYGGVELKGDTVPLLQYDLDSPALVACRREGKGFIVFKALLWNEPLSGDRFQMNLLEYSAGFQVPGPAGVGKIGHPPGPQAEYVEGEPAEPLLPDSQRSALTNDPVQSGPSAAVQDPKSHGNGVTASVGKNGVQKGSWVLELQDGTTIAGEYEANMVEFETGSSSLKLGLDKVKCLIIGDSITLDKITTSSGKQQSGLLLTTPIRFRTSRGVEEFEKEDIIKLSRSEE
jgi:hypothetical protein